MILVVSMWCGGGGGCDVGGVMVVVAAFEVVSLLLIKGLHMAFGLFAIADQVKYIMYRVIRPDCNSPDFGILSRKRI